jgi:parallel beta-helix repeat protein
VLQGFVVQGASVGIDASDSFSGYRIHHNLIQNNTLFGVDFGSAGASTSRVDHNCIRCNRWGLVSELDDDTNYPLPPVGTDPEPYARELFNARIDHNDTTGNTVGLEVAGPGRQGDITIAHNRSQRDGAGLGVGRLAGGAIVDNEIRDTTELRSAFGAIMIDPGTEDLVVAHNRAIGGTTWGISFTGGLQPAAAASRRLLIAHNEIRGMLAGMVLLAPYSLVDSEFVGNTVAGNRGSGITLNSGARNTVTRNTATGNASSGIFLGATTTGYEVHDNVSDGNGRNGIGVGAGATGHRIAHNSMHGNGAQNPLLFFDANDANFARNLWIDNDCDTDFPHGAICGVG